MEWNITEIMGKLVGSGLFVYGLTDFLRIMFKYSVAQNSQDLWQVAYTVVEKGWPGQAYPVIPADYSMQIILMVIGLFLLFIKYPEK